jgi:hypothetical protein
VCAQGCAEWNEMHLREQEGVLREKAKGVLSGGSLR